MARQHINASRKPGPVAATDVMAAQELQVTVVPMVQRGSLERMGEAEMLATKAGTAAMATPESQVPLQLLLSSLEPGFLGIFHNSVTAHLRGIIMLKICSSVG